MAWQCLLGMFTQGDTNWLIQMPSSTQCLNSQLIPRGMFSINSAHSCLQAELIPLQCNIHSCVLTIPAIFMATGSSETGTGPSLTSTCFSGTREDVAGGVYLVSTYTTDVEAEGLELWKRLAHDFAGWLTGTDPASGTVASVVGEASSGLAWSESVLSTVCNSTPLAAVSSPEDSSVCPLVTPRVSVVSVPA